MVGPRNVDSALYTLDDLSKILKIPTGSIRNQLCRGTFPIRPLKIGRLLRFKVADIEQYLESLDCDQFQGGAA